MSNMGERIRMLREGLHMTQEELGEKIGVKKAAVNKYETGDVENIKRSSLFIMAELFGVSPSYLLGWDGAETIEDSTAEKIQVDELIEKAYGGKTVELVKIFQQLNDEGKQKVCDFVSDLIEISKYCR